MDVPFDFETGPRKAFSELKDCKNHFFQVRDPWTSASSRAKTHRASPRQTKSSSYITTESAAVSSEKDPWCRHEKQRGNREVTRHFHQVQFSKKGWQNSKVCGMHGACVYSSDCCTCTRKHAQSMHAVICSWQSCTRLNLGFKSIVLNWFADYLSQRMQSAVISGLSPSPPVLCTCGVPQGSVLCPLLLSLYTHQVPKLCPSVHTQVFADDIMLDLSDDSIQHMNAALTQAVQTLANWLGARGLILNEKRCR